MRHRFSIPRSTDLARLPRALLLIGVAVAGLGLTACTTEDSPPTPEATVPAVTVEAATAEAVAPVSSPADDSAASAAWGTIVEDWGSFEDVAAVEAAISRNLGQGDNEMTLDLEAEEMGAALGTWLALTYDIGAAEPHDFVGFDRTLDAQADWSGAGSIAVWLDPSEAPGTDFVLQWREGSGEVWRYQGPLAAVSPGEPLVLPLSTDYFARADWSTTANEQIDLGDVNQYGLYVGHAGPGATGTLRVGPVVLQP
jgi:hypothetical protein